MVEFLFERHFSVDLANGLGKARTRRRQSFKPGLLQQEGGACIPRVGNDKGLSAFMKCLKDISFFDLAGHSRAPPTSDKLLVPALHLQHDPVSCLACLEVSKRSVDVLELEFFSHRFDVVARRETEHLPRGQWRAQGAA